MGRFRNPRYAPESLERKLSPSAVIVDLAPPALVAPSPPIVVYTSPQDAVASPVMMSDHRSAMSDQSPFLERKLSPSGGTSLMVAPLVYTPPQEGMYHYNTDMYMQLPSSNESPAWSGLYPSADMYQMYAMSNQSSSTPDSSSSPPSDSSLPALSDDTSSDDNDNDNDDEGSPIEPPVPPGNGDPPTSPPPPAPFGPVGPGYMSGAMMFNSY